MLPYRMKRKHPMSNWQKRKYAKKVAKELRDGYPDRADFWLRDCANAARFMGYPQLDIPPLLEEVKALVGRYM